MMRSSTFSTILGLLTLASVAAAADGPDLELDVARMQSSARIVTGVYHKPGRAPSLDATVPVSGTCVLDPDENCVGGPGIRKLLRFDVLVHNRGNEDLVVGDPKEKPDLFVYSSCHRHYHFKGAALYELLDSTGKLVKTGRKQGFCIEDTLPSAEGAPPKRYDCKNQGIQVGWADWYPSILDCQWIDITDLTPGQYMLHVFWNPNHLMAETTLDNNQGTVPITIPAATDAAPEVTQIKVPFQNTAAQSGGSQEIRWAAHDDAGIVTQELWFSIDDGATWQQIVGDAPGDRFSFRWRVPPRTSTTKARIKVVARDASVQRGELVSERFRIVSAHVTRLPRRTTN